MTFGEDHQPLYIKYMYILCLLPPDDSNDTNLCSGRPVGAVTTLRNGTVVVFRGRCLDTVVSPVTTVKVSLSCVICDSQFI